MGLACKTRNKAIYSFGVQGGRNRLEMRLATVSLLSLWFTDCSSLISRPCAVKRTCTL